SSEARYSPNSGASSRPRLTYRAASTSPVASRPRHRRNRALNRRSGEITSEQHHVVLFLGVLALDLELDGATDERLQIRHVAGLLVEQAVDHLLVGQHQVGLGLEGPCLAQDLAE